MGRIKDKYLTFLIVGILVIDIVGGFVWYLNKSNLLKFLKKPNVILISIDTLRPDHLKVYGYPKDTSPNITAWAEKDAYIMQGMYTQVPMTYPSFAAFMTGVSPFESHIYNNGMISEDENNNFTLYLNPGFNPISSSTPTIASSLQSKGYVTAAFIENSALRNNETDLGRGFNIYQVAGESTDEINVTDKALEWMQDESGEDKPFFLWVHYLDPHEIFTPESENACKFNQADCSVISSRGIEALGEYAKDKMGCQIQALPQKEVKIQEALYDAEIYQTDKSVGRLLSIIKERGLDKNSIIILYSDHGEGFDHNYYFAHSNVLYESAVRVMLMISRPGVKAGGQKILTPITNTDIFPTLMELLDFPSNKKAASFADLLMQDSKGEVDPASMVPIFYLNQNASKFAVRQGDYKYIYTIPGRSNSCMGKSKEELYNVVTDPLETKNLVDQEKSIKDNLKSILLKKLKESRIIPTGSPTPSATQSAKKEDQRVLKAIRDLGY